MQTLIVVVFLITIGVGNLLLWTELEAHLGAQAAGWLVGVAGVLGLAGRAIWLSARGFAESALRWSCVSVAVTLLLLAAFQWPETRESRFRNQALDAALKLELAREDPGSPQAWILELERDLDVGRTMLRYEVALMETERERHRRVRAKLALSLSCIWVLGAARECPDFRVNGHGVDYLQGRRHGRTRQGSGRAAGPAAGGPEARGVCGSWRVF